MGPKIKGSEVYTLSWSALALESSLGYHPGGGTRPESDGGVRTDRKSENSRW